MNKQYETFVDRVEQLPLGKETDLEIRSLEPGKHKYEVKMVRAILAREAKDLKGSDILKLRLPLGEPAPGNWAIKVLKELP